MSGLAVFLIAVGIADICRRLTEHRWPAVLAAVLTVVACAGLAGLWHPGDIAPLLIAAAASAVWVAFAARAERTGEHEAAALSVFAAAVVVLIVLSGFDSPVAGAVAWWLPWAAIDVEPHRALIVVAVMLMQLVTGNTLVRLVLGAVGAVRPFGQPQPSDRLKGGRLLGPMERLLIVGLGLAGQLGAASAVIAAKGIIRFPELSAQRKEADAGSGIDEVTEYFLVGSFASWIVAMAGLALTAH